jgi:CubicO group peptidase (beta-lactamase class C family)
MCRMSAKHPSAIRRCAACAFLLVGAVGGAGRLPAREAVDLSRLRDAARAEMAAQPIPGMGVAVVSQGRVVFAEGFGVASVETRAPIAADTVFQIGSVGKMLTSAAVVQVAGAGKLSLQEPVGRVVKGLDPAIAIVTPHQLLSQTSGLRDMPGEYGEQAEEAHGRFLRSLGASDRILAPGQTFSYSNIGFSLAGLAGAEAAGAGYADLMTEQLFEPLGMSRSTIRPTEAMTWPLAVGHRRERDEPLQVVRPLANDTRLWPAGYAYSTAADMARFALAIVDGGRIEGRQVLRPETARLMLSGHAALPNIFEGGRYGYGVILYPLRGVQVAEHAGSMPGFAALVRMVPSHRFAVVTLANGEVPAARTADTAMELFLTLTPADPPPVDGPALPMTAAEMNGYAGTYRNRGTFVLAVDNGALTLRQNQGPPLPVTKIGADRFVAAGPNNRPRLRFLLAVAREDRPAYLHFSLWGFRKVS